MNKFEKWEIITVKEEIKNIEFYRENEGSKYIKEEMRNLAGKPMKISNIVLSRNYVALYKLEDGYWYPEKLLEKRNFKNIFNKLEVKNA